MHYGRYHHVQDDDSNDQSEDCPLCHPQVAAPLSVREGGERRERGREGEERRIEEEDGEREREGREERGEGERAEREREARESVEREERGGGREKREG